MDSDLDYEPGELSGSDSAPIGCVTLWASRANLEGIGIGGDVLTLD